MDHFVTVGMIVWPFAVIIGGAVVLAILIWILSAIASGFTH